MTRPKVKAEPFIGKEAYLAARAAAPAAVLCTLTVDSHASADGTPRYMLGGEPVLTLDGARLVDAHGRPSYVTSAGSGPSVGKHLLMAYLPPDLSAVGHAAARGVHGRAVPGDGGVAGGRVRPGRRRGCGEPAMEILVCVKRVPTVGGAITLTADPRAIDTKASGFTISPHEECAVEEAVRLVERFGGSVTVVSLGPAEAEEQLRACLALGASAAVLVETAPGVETGPMATAAALHSVAASGGFDLVLLGNEASDTGGYQVGIRLAHLLGRPVATGIKAIDGVR